MKKTEPSLLLLLLRLLFLLLCFCSTNSSDTNHEIKNGFRFTPNTDPSLSFQPILADPSDTFSLGFSRSAANPDALTLAVRHLPSSVHLWRAPSAADSTRPTLTFNGSLVLSDPDIGFLWSTPNAVPGDRLVLLNDSNLRIQAKDPNFPLWESFDFPTNTLVTGQNFTANETLVSDSVRFALRIAGDFFGLYADFGGDARPMYYKQTPLEAKAQIVPGAGPVYLRLSPDGFLGMYQTEAAPVDVLNFDTFNHNFAGGAKPLRRVTLEDDGNLRAYYFNGSSWVADFEAISDPCELPSACGTYGLCGPRGICGSLVNRTSGDSSAAVSASGDACRGGFSILRRKGVELPYKELMGFEKAATLEECEGGCYKNCSCWGVVYNNVSGFCYRIDFPVQTLIEVGDERKAGYFKVKLTAEQRRKRREWIVVGAVLVGVGIVVLIGSVGLGYRVWEKRKVGRVDGLDGERRLSPGPYRNLNSSGSFNSVELSFKR
ncbi:PAN domain-containing protein [Acorus gramineus]|uniref:PAN domain-containing protein n=1 Tax=Acorus gramineus TaxID=55184 RepID=A0AAV9AH98_ACOGR|nr:PAN domain-containing protein [Acorus gramineus]